MKRDRDLGELGMAIFGWGLLAVAICIGALGFFLGWWSSR